MGEYMNELDILGYHCRFVRCECGRKFKWGYASCNWVYGVFLNDVFVGTVQSFTSNGWNFVAQLQDNTCAVIRGVSRVKAVESYIWNYILAEETQYA